MSTTDPYAAPEPEAELVAVAPEPEKLEAPDGTIDEVLDWVGDDAAKAKIALDAEQAGKKRATLIKQLKTIL